MNASNDILVIDDEPVVLTSIRKVLLDEGLSIDEASDAETAVARLQVTAYRLILCDVKLPGADGFEVLDVARARLPSAPVVMITGYATLDSAITSFRCGAFDVLPKPFDVGELLGVVHRALSYASSEGATGSATDLEEFRAAVHGDPTRRCLELHALGRHSWVSLEAGGSARIWTGETFAGVGGAQSISLPTENEELIQGNRCCRIVAEGDLVHRVWSPLSGSVVATNQELLPGLDGASESIARKWIVRIVPTSLDSELPHLTRR